MLDTPWRLFPRLSLSPPPNPPSPSCSTSRDVVLVVGAAILGGAVVAIGAPLLSSHSPHFPYASQPRGWLHEIFDRVVAFWGDTSRNGAGPGKFFVEAVPKSGDAAVDAGLRVEILKEIILGDSVDMQELNCFKSVQAENLDHYNPCKRQGYLSWEDYFMAIAFLSAQRSKDPNRQVGACLVSQDNVILGIGYNGFPRGCSDDELPWAKKSVDGDPLKTKYPYVCHAEVNAILNKNHASACGQKLFVTMFPCNECAKIIIQAGIAEVVYYTEKLKTKVASDFSYAASRKLLSMAKVKVSQHVFAK